nr:MAG TPA: hypothetical protein [Caudoviricetes sp.]
MYGVSSLLIFIVHSLLTIKSHRIRVYGRPEVLQILCRCRCHFGLQLFKPLFSKFSALFTLYHYNLLLKKARGYPRPYVLLRYRNLYCLFHRRLCLLLLIVFKLLVHLINTGSREARYRTDGRRIDNVFHRIIWHRIHAYNAQCGPNNAANNWQPLIVYRCHLNRHSGQITQCCNSCYTCNSKIHNYTSHSCACWLICFSILLIASVTGPLHPCSFNPFKQASTPYVSRHCSDFICSISLSCLSCFKNHLWAAKTAEKMAANAVIALATVIIVFVSIYMVTSVTGQSQRAALSI